MTEPTPGRVVLYVVARHDLDVLKGELGDSAVIVEATESDPPMLCWKGNPVKVGDLLPFEIVKTWHEPGKYSPGSSCVNGKLSLDGPGPAVWLTSRVEDSLPGTWRWPITAPASSPK